MVSRRQTYSVAEERELWPGGHRPCVECKAMKRFSHFHKHKGCVYGVNTVCKACRKPKSKRRYRGQTHENRMYHAAKSRATKLGIAFEIDIEDIKIPERCPILKERLRVEDRMYTPSLDRLEPSKGYTKGNVWVISNKANMIKNSATLEELKKLADWINSGCEIVY